MCVQNLNQINQRVWSVGLRLWNVYRDILVIHLGVGDGGIWLNIRAREIVGLHTRCWFLIKIRLNVTVTFDLDLDLRPWPTTFDLWPWPWPWGVILHVEASDIAIFFHKTWIFSQNAFDLDLWSWPLTLTFDLDLWPWPLTLIFDLDLLALFYMWKQVILQFFFTKRGVLVKMRLTFDL